MKCPICGKELGPNEKIVIEWYEHRRWFVLFHNKDVQRSAALDEETGDWIETEKRRGWCAQADHVSTHTLRDEWRK